QPRGVGGDVGARLVDDPDHPKRYADACNAKPVGALPLRQHAAQRIGPQGDVLQPLRPGVDAGRIQRQAGEPGGARAPGACPRPLARPASMSRALAARISAVRARSASAAVWSARSRASAPDSASARDAPRARVARPFMRETRSSPLGAAEAEMAMGEITIR